MKKKQMLAIFTALSMGIVTCVPFPCAAEETESSVVATTEEEKNRIESTLDLANNKEVTWSYDSATDSWTMSVTAAVADPELPDYQGVSVNVPGTYVLGIDTDGDGSVDISAENWSDAINGTLVINENGEIQNENGQLYTAKTAPVVINTGAAGYSAQQNQLASSSNAAYGYINVACGNRGKQSTAEDKSGETYYTGDAPLCLVDQKNAIRFVKYNILLGNLPGNTECFVSTGGSGGGAHAAMVAATSNNSDFFAYEVEAGAVGVYANEDGTYAEDFSDGVWGCVAYSAITSLQEADMAMAFEYNLDTDYEFNTSFQKQLAEYLSEEYMDYINSQDLSISESAIGIDLNEDGDTDDTVELTIEYDPEKYADTNGYGGTYLTLYLKELEQNLEWYLENLDYAEGWTWFDSDGNALSDEAVAAMTTEEKAEAFLEGRYAKSQSAGMGGPGGGMGAPDGEKPDELPDGEKPADLPDGSELPDGNDGPDGRKGAPDGDSTSDRMPENSNVSDEAVQKETANHETVTSGMGAEVGTPDAGTTQSASSATDSSNYSSYEEMLEAYKEDISSIESGDKYGNNIVDLYDPLNYIGDENTEAPNWTRIVMGASEGDMSLFASMNLQIAWLNSGTDAKLEWQWDGGHVPSEIFGESLALYIDEMYGKYTEGAAEVTKAAPEKQAANGEAEEASGTDISSWVSYEDGMISFTLKDAAAYRVKGASKATPGFDVMDYGQETYEFGNATQDARHFDKYVLKALEENADTLSTLFNQGS